MSKARLDSYGEYPSGLKEYLSFNGWHFNKRMCEFAVGNMRKTNDRGVSIKITPYRKEDVDNMLAANGVIVNRVNDYDYVYVANMCKADFYNSSITNEKALCKFVKDYIEDPDAYEGMPFTRFYADCIGSGTIIPWEEVI